MSRTTRLVLVLIALALFAAMLLLGRRGDDRAADAALPAGATPVEVEAAPAVKMAELGEKLDTIADDIEECLAAWKELDPRIDGTAMLAFQISPAGLGDVWLAEHAELPAATATCFSSAVYALDWTGLTDSPIEITQRYQDGAEGSP